MTRLLIHVEGQTEETFVNALLGPHLYDHGYSVVGARLMGNARQRAWRGGVKPWPAVRREIANHLRQDPGCIASTMVDYYGLPQSGQRAWPGRGAASQLAFPEKASKIEDLLLAEGLPAYGQQLQSGPICSVCDDARVRGHALQRLCGVRPWDWLSRSSPEPSSNPRWIWQPGKRLTILPPPRRPNASQRSSPDTRNLPRAC